MLDTLLKTKNPMQKIIDKAAILIEALPYIQRFRNKIVVIKYGGSTMGSDATTTSILKDIVLMEIVGMHPIVVHGGGTAISKRLQEKRIEPEFVEGLRITNEATMQVAEEVLMEVNRGLVEEIEAFGGMAKGLSGKDDNILHVQKKHIPTKVGAGEGAKPVDLGYVGEVTQVKTEQLQQLCDKDIVPVIAPLGLGEEGHAYNLNADTAAGEIAAALGAEKLVYLTNVEGIFEDKDDPNSLLSSVHVDEVETLIEKNVIAGGMIPKVRSGLKSVKAGVAKTHIIDGRLQHSLLLEIFTDKGVGTQIIR